MDKEKDIKRVKLTDGTEVPESSAIQLFDGTWVRKTRQVVEAYVRYGVTGLCLKTTTVPLSLQPTDTVRYGINELPRAWQYAQGLRRLRGFEVYVFEENENGVALDHDSGRYEYTDYMCRGVVSADGETGWFSDDADSIYVEGIPYLNESIARERGCRFCSNCDEWHRGYCEREDYSDDDCGNSSHRATYHSLERIDKRRQGYEFSVGMEIEKEDEDVLDKLSYKDAHRAWGWCIEEDGSLEEGEGFEAISPIFDLFDTETIDKHLTNFKDILNAKYTSNCGGHIHISQRGKNARDLYETLSPYYPLLFAMYPSRLSRNYSQAGAKDRMRQNGKYASVALHEMTVEFRIFPSPRSLSTQQWRLDLLRIFVTTPAHSYNDVIDMLLNPKSLLFTHLTIVYPSPERYITVVKRTIDACKEFEGVDISKEKEITELETTLRKLYKKTKNEQTEREA